MPTQTVTPSDGGPHRHDQHQYLTFMLGREAFALGILSIKEILEYSAPTEIPMAAAFIRGVVNLRGAAVPVIDLCTRFNRPSLPVTKKTCIVILETVIGDEHHVVGMLVDAVNEVLEIQASDVEPAPTFGASIRTDFIQGMGKVRGKFVVILNLDGIVSEKDLAATGAAAPDALVEAA